MWSRDLTTLLLLLSFGCAAREPDEVQCGELSLTSAGEAKNLALVVSDTLRRDRIGSYGGPADTPTLNAFARDHLVFERAFTQAPWTKPAIATLFTSLYPSQHQVTSHTDAAQRFAHQPLKQPVRVTDVLGEEFTTLAEVLDGAGYRTAAFVSNPWLDQRFGFGQGFDHYDDSFARWGAPGRTVSESAIDWLAALAPGARFFLYVHYIDVHAPYGPLTPADLLDGSEAPQVDPHSLSEAARRRIPELLRWSFAVDFPVDVVPSRPLLELAYDRGVEEFDSALAPLLASLALHPDYPRTAVIVTSDHGESLFERGFQGHGTSLFLEEVAVPFLARLPGVSPQRSRVLCPIGLVDLLPAVCEYLAVDCPSRLFGVSFLGPDAQERPIISEGVHGQPRHRAIRSEGFTLILEPDGPPLQSLPDVSSGPRQSLGALYRRGDDPGERRNLFAGARPSREDLARGRSMIRRMRELVPPPDPREPQIAPLDRDLRDQLKEMGYWR